MRIVKLNKTHNLFRSGFTHAFRFSCWVEHQTTIFRMTTILTERYGTRHVDNRQWETKWGKQDNTTRRRPFWIGLKNETDVTIVMLSL